MGSKKQAQQLMQQMMSMVTSMLQPAVQAQQQEDPALARLRGDATGFLDSLKGRDFRNLKTGTFWNMDSLADRTKQAGLMADTRSGGQSAMGHIPEGLLALDKQNRADEAASDYAGEFQDSVIREKGNAQNALLGIGQMGENRKAGVTGALSNIFGGVSGFAGQQANKPSWMSSLLHGGLTALPSIVGALM